MLKTHLNSDLFEKNISNKYYLFYQAWREMTEPKTFDSYQFQSFNVINGLEELLHNIDCYLNQTVPTSHSIETVTQELIKTMGKDYVLINKFSSIRNQLLSNLSKKKDSFSSYKALRYQLEFYKKELITTYDDLLIDSLIECINNLKNTEIINLASTFISRCVDTGWSARALHTRLDLTNNKDLAESLKKIFHSTESQYILLFPFRLTINPFKGKTRDESKSYIIEQLKKFDIDVLETEKIFELYPFIDKTLLKNSEYMMVSCKAKDIYTASHFSILAISNALNILSFFSVIAPWSITNKTWVAYNNDNPYTKKLSPDDVYSTYEYLDSSSTVYTRVEKIINTNSLQSDIIQKLSSSFSYANLSHVSTSVEEKYMNMWIALESLSRIDSYDNIISNILDCVPNACSLRFVYKEIRNFLEDCGRCNISLEFEDIKINSQETNKEKLVSQFLQVFRSAYYSELLTRCEVCELLKHRCHEIYDIVNNEQNFILHVQNHHQAVKWHLDRLYRIRNEIAHSALSQHISIIRYTEHLYDYLSTYISEAVRFSTEKSIIDWGEITVAINDNYTQFICIANDKKTKDKKLILKKLWTSGIIDYI